MDKNLAAFLDETAYTVNVVFTTSQGNSRNYTYVTNIPGLTVGDAIVVPVAVGSKNLMPSLEAMHESRGRLQAETVETYKVAFIVGVDVGVSIEPNSDIYYRWVVSKLDLTPYQALRARHAQLAALVEDAYKRNLRRSFAERLLSELTPDAQQSIKALIKGNQS